MEHPYIYLDNNSTTRVDDLVLEAMMPFLKEHYANAGSSHYLGQKIKSAVELAREQLAFLINSTPEEIIFTSGATEAINLAIKGYLIPNAVKGNHIITVSTEHKACLDTCRYLSENGFNVSYLSVDQTGLINLDELRDLITDNTILISIMHVNNETGVIQPIKEISEIAHASGVAILVDCAQSVGKLSVDVVNLDTDLMTISSHKFYGPKGVGALYIKSNRNRKIAIHSITHGGGQEKGLRSGTLNVPGIIGFGMAANLSSDKEKQKLESNKIMKLRNKLEAELLLFNGSFINGNILSRIYNVSNICFPKISSEALIMILSRPIISVPIIAISNGSACSSDSIEPSHVLLSMGLDIEHSFNSIRFSLGRFNTESEINISIEVIKNALSKLKDMSDGF